MTLPALFGGLFPGGLFPYALAVDVTADMVLSGDNGCVDRCCFMLRCLGHCASIPGPLLVVEALSSGWVSSETLGMSAVLMLQVEASCKHRCLEDLTSTTRFVTW